MTAKINKNIFPGLLLIGLILCVHTVYAQDLTFSVSLSKSEVGTGEPFEITFSANGNMDTFIPPEFPGFQVVSGPNVSQSMTSVNGKTAVSISYSYGLIATREGTFTLGPAFMVSGGHRISSGSAKIKVVKGSPARQNNQAADADLELTDGSRADLSKSLFIKSVTDKRSVYQGEQIALSYRLYTRIGIVDSRVDKLPDLTGFWSEDVKNPRQQAQWRTETYKGVKYNVADIKQAVLFPEHSGDLRIDPFEMTFIVRVQAPERDIMDQFFGSYQDVKYQAKSAPVVIHVRPLPEQGKPSGFSGAVGRFSVKATADKDSLKANEALNYSIKISGAGNLRLLKTLEIKFPQEFESYDPKITDSVSEADRGLSGRRAYTYLLIPKKHGNYSLASFHFSYFDPVTGSYTTLTTAPLSVKVSKGIHEQTVSSPAPAGQQDLEAVYKEIRTIKTGRPDLSEIGKSFYGSLAYYLLLFAGPVACVVSLIYRNQLRRYNSDVVKVKDRRAGKVAAKHLADARQQLLTQQSATFYEAIFRGVYGYLSDKLDLTAAELSREVITSRLAHRGAGEGTVRDLMDLLDSCEMARYSPAAQVAAAQVFDNAKRIINDIEHEI